MRLVLRTTNEQAEPAAAPLPLPPGSDPLLRLQHETQPLSGPDVTRCTGHPRELPLRGIPVMCPACQARRDWVLINHRRNVWIGCRCGHQWLEPEITRADFDGLLTTSNCTTYPSLEQALTAHGFDGSFAGTYLM
ncbi:hypothetical protein [Actinacidiphila acididurans]|uniref:Uncharacterized protein n=1 Tax=Actinacidiphila acididurans TaxID=2784346 RepID=A0ABS2TXG8_9ACTN|nr:hypothetical protein [Actinacidiphila acididurans]MBM9508029.1 hypothetical protein [Actinacidiphila acididurans]